MSTDPGHGPGTPAGDSRHRSTALVLAAAVAWGLLVVLAAMTVPVVTVQPPAVTATATASANAAVSAPASTSDEFVYRPSPRVTVLAHDGPAAVALAAVPAAVSLLVAGLLGMAAGGRRPGPALAAAWVLSGAVVAAGVVGFVTILVGIVAVPSGVLLLVACAQTRQAARPLPPVPVPA